MYEEIAKESVSLEEAFGRLKEMLGRKLNFVEREEMTRTFRRKTHG